MVGVLGVLAQKGTHLMATTTLHTPSDDHADDVRLARYKAKDVVVEQDVPLPDLEFARNGTRKGSSRAATKLTQTVAVSLRPAACAMLADVVDDISRVTDIARNHALTPRKAANVELGQVVGRVISMAVLVLSNERVGHVRLTQVKPATQAYDAFGLMLAEAEREIESYAVLRDAVFETVRHTMALGGNYTESIIATGVIDPPLLRLTRTHLRQENVTFHALEAPDGTTRTIDTLAALLDTNKPEDVAEFVMTSFFDGYVEPHDGDSPLDITDTVRENLRKSYRGVVNDYWTRVGRNGEDDPHALRIRQSLSLPAELTLSVRAGARNAHTYVQALDVLVRNTHMNRRNWEAAAESSNLARTVITALTEQGLLSAEEQDLLIARTPAECEAALAALGYTSGGDVDPTLWRAAAVLSLFSQPRIQKAAKAVICQALNLTQIRNQRYAAVLSTLIDLPWRDTKRPSARQAHNAWERGGALTKDMLLRPWTVKFAPTIADLASDNSRDAELTLAAVGGTALVADRFMTADAIAGTGDAGRITMPYKVSLISTLVEMLARSENTGGRTQLALAASAFRPEGESASAWRQKERKDRSAELNALLASNAKARAAGRPQDVVAVPVYYDTPAVTGGELNAVELMTIADHDGARASEAGSKVSKPGPKDPPKSPLEAVEDTRRTILRLLDSTLTNLGTLRSLADKHTLPALDQATYDAARASVDDLFMQVRTLRPLHVNATSEAVDAPDADPDEDTVDFRDTLDEDLDDEASA